MKRHVMVRSAALIGATALGCSGAPPTEPGNSAPPFATHESADAATLNSGDLATLLGQVAYYPLDGDAKDVGGNGHDGEVHGATATSDRNATNEGALHFDGIDDYIKLPYDASFYPTSLGLSLWVRVDNVDIGHQVLLTANGSGASPPFDPYGISILDGTTVAVRFEGNNPPGPPAEQINLTGTITPTDGWHHVAASYDAVSGLARLWLDGALVDQTREVIVLGTNTLGLMLGARQNPSGQPFGHMLNGGLDEVRIFSRALSARDVRILCDVPTICRPGRGRGNAP